MVLPRVWVLVADARHARIVRKIGSGASAPEIRELVLRARSTALRRIVQDGGRPDVRAADWPEAGRKALREDLRAFAEDVVRVLDSHRVAGDFERLVVVAPADMMAALRAAMPATLRMVVAAEFVRDMTGLPEAELREAVSQLLPRPGSIVSDR